MVPLSTAGTHLKALVGQRIVGIARPCGEGLRPYYSDAIPNKNYLIGRGRLALLRTQQRPILGFRPRERGMHVHIAPIEELFNPQFPNFARENENLQVKEDLGNEKYEVEIGKFVIGRTIISVDIFVRFAYEEGIMYREERALRFNLDNSQVFLLGFHIGPDDAGYALRFLRVEHIESHLYSTSRFMGIDEVASMGIPSNLHIDSNKYY